jgi:hypothetical protein
MRISHGFRTASKESYNKFCIKYPEYDITFEQFKKVLYHYNNLLAVHMMETGDLVKLPFGLGKLVINKYKPNKTRLNTDGDPVDNLTIDWKQTKEAGKYIYNFNNHTDGYKYYWMWNHWTSHIKCSFVWKLEMARVHSRVLAALIKKSNSKYKNLYKQYSKYKK